MTWKAAVFTDGNPRSALRATNERNGDTSVLVWTSDINRCRGLRRTLAVGMAVVLMEDLEEELTRLRDIEFEHQGCRMLRTKDNEYLIQRAEKAEKEVDRLKDTCEWWGSNYQSWVDGFAALRADIQELVDNMGRARKGDKYISEELVEILDKHPKVLKVEK